MKYKILYILFVSAFSSIYNDTNNLDIKENVIIETNFNEEENNIEKLDNGGDISKLESSEENVVEMVNTSQEEKVVTFTENSIKS